MYFKSMDDFRRKKKKQTRIFMTCILFLSLFSSSSVKGTMYLFEAGLHRSFSAKKKKKKEFWCHHTGAEITLLLRKKKAQLDYTVIEAFGEVMLAANTKALFSAISWRGGSIL